MRLLYFGWVRTRIGMGGEEVEPPDTVTDVEGLIGDEEGRRVVEFVGADRLVVEAVVDVVAGFLFHQGGAVVFAQFGEGWAHVPQDFGVVFVVVVPGGAAAEELGVGQELLMHLQAAFEPEGGIVLGRHFDERLET